MIMGATVFAAAPIRQRFYRRARSRRGLVPAQEVIMHNKRRRSSYYTTTDEEEVQYEEKESDYHRRYCVKKII